MANTEYTFNVDPEKVAEAARNLDTAMEALSAAGEEFYDTFQGISDSDWGAQSKDITVEEKLNEFYPGLAKMKEFIYENVEFLTTAATSYETAEQTNIATANTYEGNVIK